MIGCWGTSIVCSESFCTSFHHFFAFCLTLYVDHFVVYGWRARLVEIVWPQSLGHRFDVVAGTMVAERLWAQVLRGHVPFSLFVH